MSGDLREAIQILAADNARMCTRLIAAEELAERLRRWLDSHASVTVKQLEKALEAYEATRPV